MTMAHFLDQYDQCLTRRSRKSSQVCADGHPIIYKDKFEIGKAGSNVLDHCNDNQLWKDNFEREIKSEVKVVFIAYRVNDTNWLRY